MAVCKTCNSEFLDDSKFRKRVYCEFCRKEKVKERARLAIRKRYQAYYLWLKEMSCRFCGQNSPSCLEVHHLCKNTKRYGSTKIRGQSDLYNKEDVLNGCAIVLCANCHSTFHRHWGGKGANFPDQTIESTLEVINMEYNKWRCFHG